MFSQFEPLNFRSAFGGVNEFTTRGYLAGDGCLDVVLQDLDAQIISHDPALSTTKADTIWPLDIGGADHSAFRNIGCTTTPFDLRPGNGIPQIISSLRATKWNRPSSSWIKRHR